MRNKEEYDWLDDPFDEKKNEKLRMSGGSKAAVGVGCAVAVVLIVVLAVVSIMGLANVGSTL